MYLGSLSVCLAVYVANPSVPDRNEKRGRQPVFVPNSICRSTYQAERTPARSGKDTENISDDMTKMRVAWRVVKLLWHAVFIRML